LSEADEELSHIRDFLLSARAEPPSQLSRSLRSEVIDRKIEEDAERQAALRSLGYNRRERENLRQGQRNRSVRQPNEQLARKRIAFYINERVDWDATDVNRLEAIDAWASLAAHDVGLVLKWWDSGVHPLDFAEVRELLGQGMDIEDVFAVIEGKTVIEHIRAGTSATWCRYALDWHGRP
jgi:hypothetical protein